MKLDFISDIHGDLDRMVALLEALDYDLQTMTHPEGRQAVFLGDFIDRGSSNLAVLLLMDSMRKAGLAFAIMGNHELNAILFHADDGAGDGLRPRTEQNRHHHAAFLRGCPLGSSEAAEALSIMMSLPLFLDFGGVRAVHAFWRDDVISTITARRPDARIAPEDLAEIAEEHDGGPFAAAVTLAAKGPEMQLPAGAWYADNSGTRRETVRLRWWGQGQDLHASITSCPDFSRIPNGPAPAGVLGLLYPADAPPVIFGHYQLVGQASLSANTLCLDVPDRPLAYRWDGEAELALEKILDPAPAGMPEFA